MSAFDAWVQRYVQASRSPDPDAVAALFTVDATYSTSPFDEPIAGREAIVRWWADQPAPPFEASWNVLAEDGPTGIIDVSWAYEATPDSPARAYADVWLVRLTDEGCSEFREWFMRRPDEESGS